MLATGEEPPGHGARQPRLSSISSIALEAPRVEEVNEEETVDMSREFFHGFHAIRTLGSASITKEPMTREVAMPFESTTEEETSAAENELQSPNKKLEKPIDKEVHDVSNESSKQKVVKLDDRKLKAWVPKRTKVFWKSRKIHPEALDLHVNKLHNYKFKQLLKTPSKLEKEKISMPNLRSLIVVR
ncbi:hypothetical protein L6452_42313 [Arctium lappa]|uniref:Uncharacterized protein n=1 Tax=Arctium lappa TaxID=4217 RepID=A0ACB8XIP2_ARCLA|nr:hypothetical protein L6452_42313 [Arctium lappa]